jgi:hypothetical protein
MADPDPDSCVLEVPTVRPDTQTQWIALAVLLLDVLVITRHGSLLFQVGAWTLAAAGVVAVVAVTSLTSKRWPAVRLTAVALQLPAGEKSTVTIDWADITAFSINHRGLVPHLVVEPADPDLVRPAPDRWQRAAGTRGDRYRLSVALGGDHAARKRLRAELTARIRNS